MQYSDRAYPQFSSRVFYALCAHAKADVNLYLTRRAYLPDARLSSFRHIIITYRNNIHIG